MPDRARAGLPRVVVREPGDSDARRLREIQLAILKHPVAAQAAFAALVAEGRRFAQTEEGATLMRRLTRSALLDRVRLAFETSTLWVLDADASETLPSAYLDALFQVASGPELELVLDRLFPDREADGKRGA